MAKGVIGVAGRRRTRGDGALYQRADGMWMGSVELGFSPDGKRRRKVVSSSTQAGALAKLREARRNVERYGTVPTQSQTVKDWLDRWLVDVCAPRVKPRTLDGYRDKVRLIDESIGKVRLDKLAPEHVRRVHTHAAAGGRSGTTALHCHRVLSKALKDAQREGLVLRNVAELVDAPSADTFDGQPLTGDEARRFLRWVHGEPSPVARDPLAARWDLALLYGMRQGEALGLTWECVDLDAGTLDLSWQLQRFTWRHGCAKGAPTCGGRRGADCPKRTLAVPAKYEHRVLEGALVLSRPKREKRRMVPILPLVEAGLRERIAIARFDPNPHGLVFARRNGSPIAPTADAAAWDAHLRALGLPDIRLHDARHSAATLLLEGGIDEATIAQILGHSLLVTTRRYAHVNMDLMRAALEVSARRLEA